MSYDIKVLSVGAVCKLNMSCGSIIAERAVIPGKEFSGSYPFVSKIGGEWFGLIKEGSPKNTGSFDVCDFDFGGGEHELSWRTGASAVGHYSLLFRSEELFSDFRLVMKQLRKISLVFPQYAEYVTDENAHIPAKTRRQRTERYLRSADARRFYGAYPAEKDIQQYLLYNTELAQTYMKQTGAKIWNLPKKQ